MSSSDQINQTTQYTASIIGASETTESQKKLYLFQPTHTDITVVDQENKVICLVKINASYNQSKELKDNAISLLKQDLPPSIKPLTYTPLVGKTELVTPNKKIERCLLILVNLVNIDVFRLYTYDDTYDDMAEHLLSLKTSEILNYYDPDFSSKKKIFDFYLKTLVEAWLRDLAYHWKSETPPGSNELAEISLLTRIAGGDAYSIAPNKSPLFLTLIEVN